MTTTATTISAGATMLHKYNTIPWSIFVPRPFVPLEVKFCPFKVLPWNILQYTPEKMHKRNGEM